MSMPVPEPGGLGPPRVQPYYVRDTQPWAIEQERQRHNQALFMVGEYAMFVLMWHNDDERAGLVQRCSDCMGTSPSDAVKAKVAAAYKQAEEYKCPTCFGTTFEGGFKARIIRPAIFSDADEDEQKSARGVVKPQDLSVESTTDFRVRSGDYVFRATGDRYYLRVPQRITLRTGFAVPHQSEAAIGYNHARASQEDLASVAYDIPTGPPGAPPLADILTMGSRVPIDFDTFETIRGPLIPVGDD